MHTTVVSFFFFFNDTATTEIYTLSLHDALPISPSSTRGRAARPRAGGRPRRSSTTWWLRPRSEEHTSELQSRPHLVCRLLLEKKKTKQAICGRTATPLLSVSASRALHMSSVTCR